MSTGALGRRRFLGLGLRGAIAAAIGLLFTRRRGEPLTAERLLGALGLVPAKSAIGNLGLRVDPAETDSAAVLRALVADLGRKSRARDDAELRHAVVRLVTRDYEEGRIRWVGGFCLSRTEVRLAALQRTLWAGQTSAPAPAAAPSGSPAR